MDSAPDQVMVRPCDSPCRCLADDLMRCIAPQNRAWRSEPAWGSHCLSAAALQRRRKMRMKGIMPISDPGRRYCIMIPRSAQVALPKTFLDPSRFHCLRASLPRFHQELRRTLVTKKRPFITAPLAPPKYAVRNSQDPPLTFAAVRHNDSRDPAEHLPPVSSTVRLALGCAVLFCCPPSCVVNLWIATVSAVNSDYQHCFL